MKCKIINEFSYQTFPIVDNMIEIDEEILKEIGISKKFKDGQVIDYNNNNSTLERIDELKSLLQSTDYKAIKFAEGELSIEEYTPVKIQRTAWRNEINLLERSL